MAAMLAKARNDDPVPTNDAIKKTHAFGFEHIATDGMPYGRPISGNVSVKIGFRETAHRQPRLTNMPPNRLAVFIEHCS